MSVIRIRAVIFRRTIRAAYASLDLIYYDDDNNPINSNNKDKNGEHIVAIFQSPINYKDLCLTNTEDAEENPYENSKVHVQDNDVDMDDVKKYVSSWRSYIRKTCKLGTQIELLGSWISKSSINQVNTRCEENNQSQARRFLVHKNIMIQEEQTNTNGTSTQNDGSAMRVLQLHTWDISKCQAAREKYYPDFDDKNKKKDKCNRDLYVRDISIEGEMTELSLSERKQRKHRGQTGHGGGLGKKEQGEIIAEFLISLIGNNTGHYGDATQPWGQPDSSIGDVNLYYKKRFVDFSFFEKLTFTKNDGDSDNEKNQRRISAIEHLNRGSGVMDVAGGSGYVSLALALMGIMSTVIDPRETVGKLPKRDRKVLKKALKGSQDRKQPLILPPPVEFSAMRAWFVQKPGGVDLEFREGKCTPSLCQLRDEKTTCSLIGSNSDCINDNITVPVCHMCSQDGLLSSCSAIVALHPDEATGDIVDFAVKHKIPFIVVPCCVFSRLFTTRYKPQRQGQAEIVSTYDDLIEYLLDKDDSIRVSKLDFEGANLALWSVF
mmetsp:Transcript_24414/g.30044  ORF Transcript_24414/g.30044 Transcript_24414/m.30044 type:complete len:547 (+) Transcript_24414:73-1713(+)